MAREGIPLRRTIVTPDVRILITPKVDTANLFYLLEASGNPVDIGAAVFDYDKTRDLIPSFATFYARHLEKALAHGVERRTGCLRFDMFATLTGPTGSLDKAA
jgi:hypothetical protein